LSHASRIFKAYSNVSPQPVAAGGKGFRLFPQFSWLAIFH